MSQRRDTLDKVLFRGASGSFAVRVAGMGLQLVLHWILVRWLGAFQYGIVAYLLVWSQVLVLLARLGADTAIVRFAANYRVGQQWGHLRGLLRRAWQAVSLSSIGLSLLAALVVLFLSVRLPAETMPPEEVRAALWACGLVLAGSLVGVCAGTLQGLRHVVRSQVPEQVLRPLVTLGAVGAMALMAVIVGREAPPPMAPQGILALLLGALAGLLVALFWQHKALPAEVHQATPVYETRYWWRESWSLLLVSGLRPLLNQTDVLVIGILLGRFEVGLYFVATRLTGLIPFGLVASNTIAAPLISELHSQGQLDRLRRIVSLSVWGATVAAFFVTSGLLLFGRQLMESFDPSYGQGLTVLWIMSVGQLVNACTGPVGYLLNMTGHAQVNARIMGTTVVLNLLCNIPAILVFGLEGAAVVTSLLIAVKNLWTWWEVRRRLGVNSSIFAGLPRRVSEEDS